MDSRVHSHDAEDPGAPWAPAGAPGPSEWGEIDGYQPHRLLRRVASAEVYLTYHPATRAYREVVVVHRLPATAQAALLRSITAEVAAARVVGHAGALPVRDVGVTRDGRLYVATPLPDGRTLSEVVADEGRLATRRALHLGVAIVDVVAAAHAAGVVHGRLTPDSVVVVPERPGQPERVAVLGFGTALAHDGVPVPGTRPGRQDSFTSPERTAGASASLLDDVFALGSVILSMFMGGPPPVVRSEPDRPGPAAAEEPPGVIIQVLRRARAPDPNRRFASAADLGAALRAIDDALAEREARESAHAVVPPLVVPPLEVPPLEVPPVEVPPPATTPAPVAAAPTVLASPPVRTPSEAGLEGPVVLGPRRSRGRTRRALVAAGVAGMFAIGWTARAWQRRAAPRLPSPNVEVAAAERAAPARPVEPSVVAPPLAAAPPAGGAVLPSLAERTVTIQEGAPATTREAPPTEAPSDPPADPPADPPSRAGRAGGPNEALAARGVATPEREAPPVTRRRPAPAAPVVAPAARATRVAGRGAVDGRAMGVPAATTASAGGDVVRSSGGRDASAGAERGADASRPAPTGVAPTRAAPTGAALSEEGERVGIAAGVLLVVGQYASAIEARDLARLSRVYPGMTETQRRAWATFFGSVTDVRAPLVVDRITLAGATVRARVHGTYEYQNRRPHRAERSPVAFTATLARDATGWRVLAVE